MKKFLAILSLLVVTLNFVKISVASAEVKNYVARAAAILDFADEKPEYLETVKKVAKERAEKRAKERAGVFVKSFSRAVNGVLTDNDISAYTSDKIKILKVDYKKIFYQAQDTKGNLTGKVGYMYEAEVTAEIDTSGLIEYAQKSLQEKQALIERDQTAKKNFEEIDSEFENLRQNADQKTQAQIKSELEKIDNKISSQNKPVEQKNIPMIFSQSVEIGGISELINGPVTGTYYIDKANENKGTVNKNISKYYDNGIARWEILYCHYGNGQQRFLFGDSNIPNTVEVSSPSVTIYKINNSQNKPIYLLDTSWISGHSFWKNFGYSVIGKMDNGKWVKYFSVEGNYNPKAYGDNTLPSNYLTHPKNIIFQDDTIIIEFYPNKHDSEKVYEMRYKWDEKAQWFGVERVDFQPIVTDPKIQEAQKYYELAEAEWKSDGVGVDYRVRRKRILSNYTKAIELNPKLSDAYVGRSVVYEVDSRTVGELGDQNKARNDANRAIEVNPNSARAYCWRARLNEYKNPSQALSDATKAIELDKNYLDAYETRADIYKQMKNYQRAIEDLNYILNFPNFRSSSYMKHYDFDRMSDWAWYMDWEQRTAALYVKRGDVYNEKGDYNNALNDFNNALKLSPNNDWIKMRISRIKSQN